MTIPNTLYILHARSQPASKNTHSQMCKETKLKREETKLLSTGRSGRLGPKEKWTFDIGT